MSKLLKFCSAYLPALLIFGGTCLGGFGIFLGDSDGAREFGFVGTLVTAVGGLWLWRRESRSAEASIEQDAKLVALSEELRGHVTGGEGFCYGYPFMVGPHHFQWMFIHSGRFPLSDVQVRVHDCSQVDFKSKTIVIGTLFPGRATAPVSLTSDLENRVSAHAFNLFFVAKNGSWTQEIRWVDLPGVQATANRVVRDGMPIENPLLFEVSPEYPGLTPANDAWNNPPPGIKILENRMA